MPSRSAKAACVALPASRNSRTRLPMNNLPGAILHIRNYRFAFFYITQLHPFNGFLRRRARLHAAIREIMRNGRQGYDIATNF